MALVSNKKNIARKFGDPVFICMTIAMVLAVASSITLRSVVGGPTPVSAHPPEQVVEPPHPSHPATQPN